VTPNPSIERPFKRQLRCLSPAAHLQRQASEAKRWRTTKPLRIESAVRWEPTRRSPRRGCSAGCHDEKLPCEAVPQPGATRGQCRSGPWRGVCPQTKLRELWLSERDFSLVGLDGRLRAHWRLWLTTSRRAAARYTIKKDGHGIPRRPCSAWDHACRLLDAHTRSLSLLQGLSAESTGLTVLFWSAHLCLLDLAGLAHRRCHHRRTDCTSTGGLVSVQFTEAPDTNRAAGLHSFDVLEARTAYRVHLPPV